MNMIVHLRPALALLLSFTALTGIAYPLAMTGIAQLVFPVQANGSIVERDGATIGSALIGQAFASERYFHPRPSATAGEPYNAAASAASNLGPTSAMLAERVASDIGRLRASFGAASIPADAVTASGSGLDPHITPEFAMMQVPAVAGSRGVPQERIAALVAAHTEGRFLGILGERRVNVLRLNLALDGLRP
jgi:K+-transporting ATPase ATPase C chain